MRTKERNFTFDLLYALAIIMVVDDHTYSQLGILKGIFPYDSFALDFIGNIPSTQTSLKELYVFSMHNQTLVQSCRIQDDIPL